MYETVSEAYKYGPSGNLQTWQNYLTIDEMPFCDQKGLQIQG